MSAGGQAGHAWDAGANLNVGAESNIGKRAENQDRMDRFHCPFGEIFLVADGMGGHLGGATAATAVTEGFRACLQATPPATPLSAALLDAAERANSEIYERGQGGDPTIAGMGSTLVLAVLIGNQMVIAHCGDSRAYLFRGGFLRRLTRDHTAVQSLVDAGVITEEIAREHPDANVLARAFGQQAEVQLDISEPIILQPGDRLMLCSDGLSGYATDEEITGVMLAWPDPRVCTQALLELAFRSESTDNITVQVVEFGAPVSAALPAPSLPAASAVAQRMQARVEESERPPRGGLGRAAALVLASGALALGGFFAWRHYHPTVKTTTVAIQKPKRAETPQPQSAPTPVAPPPAAGAGGGTPAVEAAKPENKREAPPLRSAPRTTPVAPGPAHGKPSTPPPPPAEAVKSVPPEMPPARVLAPAMICVRAPAKDPTLMNLVSTSVAHHPELAKSKITWFQGQSIPKGKMVTLIVYKPGMEEQAEVLHHALEGHGPEVVSRQMLQREAKNMGKCQIQVGPEKAPAKKGKNAALRPQGHGGSHGY